MIKLYKYIYVIFVTADKILIFTTYSNKIIIYFFDYLRIVDISTYYFGLILNFEGYFGRYLLFQCSNTNDFSKKSFLNLWFINPCWS